MTAHGQAASEIVEDLGKPLSGLHIASVDATVERLLEGSGMVLSIVARTRQCEWGAGEEFVSRPASDDSKGLARNWLTDDRQRRSSVQRIEVV